MQVDASEVKVGDNCFHPECLVCRNCKTSLLGQSFRMKENVVYCDHCFKTMTAMRCAECRGLIKGNKRVEAMGQFYHPRHLVCFNCKCRLIPKLHSTKMIDFEGEKINHGFCAECDEKINNTLCPKCNKPLNDSLVFDGTQYTHMDCDSAPDHPIRASPVSRQVTETMSSSTSTSDSELDVHSIPNTLRYPLLTTSQVPPAPIAPVGPMSPMASQRAPRQPSEAPAAKRPEVVSSDALDKYHNFESQGVVVERSQAFAEDHASLHVAPSYQTDINAGFESAGNVRERSEAFGKKEEENLPAERELTGFESAGNVRERSEAFGKKEEVTEEKERELTGFESAGNVKERSQTFGKKEEVPEEKERELTGFESAGNVRERSTVFGRPSEVNDEEEEAMELEGFESAGNVMSRVSTFEQPAPADEATQPAERELDGFESAGNVKERVSTFGQAEAISDGSEEEKQEEEENGEDEKEREAEQERVSKLPRDELKIYPYDVLTKEPLPKDVDRGRRQYHLSDEEFQKLFGMSKDEFGNLSQGKQNWERKRHGLF